MAGISIFIIYNEEPLYICRIIKSMGVLLYFTPGKWQINGKCLNPLGWSDRIVHILIIKLSLINF